MPKGDDHLQKKRTKAVRKRMRRVGADSFEAIQGVQAAKRRRKSGTRRACEGMCYTLPTPDDPFNERSDRRKRRQENRKLRSREVPEGEILEFETDVDHAANGFGVDVNAGYDKQLKEKRKVLEDSEEEELEALLQDKKKRRKIDGGENGKEETSAVKFTQNGNGKKISKLDHVETLNGVAPSLGKEPKGINGNVINGLVLSALAERGLLNGESVTANITNGDSKNGEKESTTFRTQCRAAILKRVDTVAVSPQGLEDRVLGYAVPAAVHIKAQLSIDPALQKPLVLIIVASQQQALQVRAVCKPLKELGVSSVCVHTGTSLDAQIRGFSLLTPELVVATPERLLELLAVNAISLLSVSLLVVDGLDEIVNQGLQADLTKLKEKLRKELQTLIVGDRFSKGVVDVARQLVVDPIQRAVSEPNLESGSACIAQEVSVFTSPDKRLPKLLRILQQLKDKQEESAACSTLVLVETVEAIENLLPAIQALGDETLSLNVSKRSRLALVSKKLRNGSVKTLVTTEEFLGQIPLESMRVVINYSFPSSMKVYKQILTGMARRSVNGELHSLCTPSMASMARDLVEVLKKSLHETPRGLQMLVDAAALVQNGKE